jgi:PAS domain S-box-containing protein
MVETRLCLHQEEAMDPRALVESTGNPAFVSSQDGRIVGWNPAAERLLGHPAGSAIGRPCHAVVCGTDLSGNVFCRKDCALREMIRSQEPIHTFALEVRNASGQHVPVSCSALTLFETGSRRNFSVLHLLQPAIHWNEVSHLLESVGRQAAGSGRSSRRVGRSGSSDTANSLTRRETEVLRMLAQGLATRELAESLSVSVNTVRSHTQNILHKLGAHTKLQAVCRARHYNLI